MNIKLVLDRLPAYVAGGDCSEDTTRAYTRAGKFFINWLIQHGKEPTSATADDAKVYVRELYEQGLKRDGINQRIAGARAFFRTAISVGEFAGENPFADIKGRKPSHDDADTKYYTRDEVKRIYEACTGARERAMILLMAIEGLRTIELTRLTIQDCKLSDGRIKVHGKGRHDAYIYPSELTLQTLTEYIGTRTTGAVFTNEIDGSPITRYGIKWIVNGILKAAGLKRKGSSCHALRHSCGTNLYEATKDIRLVQETLRHTSPEVTARYTHIVNRKNATNAIVDF